MKVFLIDDEPMALENLKYVVRQFEGVDILGAYTDPIEALERLEQLKPDAVFLDIEMPQVNGFTVAEEMRRIIPDIPIVFITGFDEYAVKAFEINAIDYVLKPISKRRLEQTMGKLMKSYLGYSQYNREMKADKALTSLLKRYSKKIIAWKGEKILVVDPKQALYLYADEGDVSVVTEGEDLVVRGTLGYWEERLSESGFFRCHRAFLVNIDKIEAILPMFNNTYQIKLANCLNNIPVSRKYARQLKQILDL